MTEKFYLGSYTRRLSKGIYSIQLNKETEKLENLTLEIEINNPTYIDKKGQNIYAVGNKENVAGLSAILNNNKLENYLDSNTPCYIASNEKYILTANYHEGNVRLFEIINDELVNLDTLKFEGSGIKPQQEKAHTHYADFSPCGNFILTCDLGLDEVNTYKIVNEKLQQVSSYKAKLGTGARHLVFHPNLSIVYLLCELEATVEVLNFDKETGQLSLLQNINMLEENQKAWAAAIRITKDGKFLYTSNRGDDLLVAFSVAGDGQLTKLASYSTEGKVARDFNLSKDNDFLVVGHQESDNLTLFKRNYDGTLKLISSDTFAPEVVCVVNE